MSIKSGARADVLNFYKSLPFNASQTPEMAAELIKKSNEVSVIYPDENDLYDAETVLELGCGTGWMSNSIAYYYGAKVTAVDFNPVAIESAQKVAELLGNDCRFNCGDLFTFECEPQDVVISNGVLHHTSECMGGVQKCISLTKPGGKIFIGLYHKYGRKAFLDYFAKLKNEDIDESLLMEKYRDLDNRHEDEIQAKSWFLDQVLHPYVTQHTLKEVMEVFQRNNVQLISTSINMYEPEFSLERLYIQEKELYDVGLQELKKGKYYPGFFYVLGKR